MLDVGRTSEGTLSLLYDLVERLPVSVALYGAEAGFPLRYLNAHMVELQADGPAGLDLRSIQHPQLLEAAERLVETGSPESVQLNLHGRDGQRLLWSWALSPLRDASGAVVAFVAVVEDLSEPLLARRRIESALDQGMHVLMEVARLAEEHARMDEFLAAMSERVALLVHADRVLFHRYDPDRRALVASPETRGSLPCDPSASDLLSQVVFGGRVYSGTLDLAGLELQPHRHLARMSRERGDRVLIVPWRAGNERLGAVMAHGTRAPDGFTDENAIVLIAAGHAAGLVWQRKRAEQRLEERAAELASLERAKTAFLMLASHELRTPLTLLNGYVSMLTEDGGAPVRVDQVLPILHQAVERMNMLVDQLVDATRLADSNIRLDRQEVDLRRLVKRAVTVASRWRRAEDLELRLPDAPVLLAVDIVRVQTAVDSLVDNAFKYSEAGSPVRCDLRLEPGTVRLVVEDDGIGMSDEELAGLYTRFGRMLNAQNSHISGAGLGLFLSREIARMHGGDITATSRVGRGSRFELELPRGERIDGGDDAARDARGGQQV